MAPLLKADSWTTTSPVQELDAALDLLSGLDPTQMSAEQQGRLLVQIGRAESRLASVKLLVLAAAERAHTAVRAGAASTAQWAAKLENADTATMHRHVGLARSLDNRPSTGQALRNGLLSAEHAAVIVQADRQLPPATTAAQRAVVENVLIEKAAVMSPQALRRAARRALDFVQPDRSVVDAHEDALTADEESAARAHTRLTLHDNNDGTVTGHFTVPTLHGHIVRKILQTMTAPRRGRLGASRDQVGATSGTAGLGHAAATDWDHARGTAFCELIEHLPTDRLHPKTAATVVVTIKEETLRGVLAVARLDTESTVSAGEARRLACGAGLLPVVLGGRSMPLDLGRQKRLFSGPQRAALGARHTTCAADGCERPFAWCELHHRRPWSHGGRTDLRDAVPLCGFHHRRIHDRAFVHRERGDGAVTFHRLS